MSLKTRIQKQTCVYWAPAGSVSGGEDQDQYGSPQFTDPVELSCRWDDVAQKFTSPGGEELISRAKVLVDGVEVGGVLMLGTLDDVIDDDPLRNDGAYQIKRYDSTPDFKNRVTYYMAYL